jgi:RHS repeat-associated protein
VIVGPLAAEERGQQRYIVVIRKQRFGPPPVPDVAGLGGRIESRQDDQLVVTIPARSLAALKNDPAVLYLERVGGISDDESPLIGEPADPQPGTQSKRLTPHAMGAISWDSGSYAYDGAGNIISIGSDNYLYDGVQRLKQSSTRGTIETYTYDGFGNMKTRTNMTIPSVDSSTNRYMGYNYNQIGAVTADGSYTFTYDALGQPLRKVYNNQSNTVEDYVYTPGDERIGVQRGGWWTWSIRDEGGKVLRQYKSSATNLTDPALWLEDFVWRDGLLLGSQRPVEMGGRRHFHLDHLGTARLITSDSGQLVSYHDYYPFGDEYSPVSQESPSGFGREEPMKFTGHERDYAGGMGAEDGHAVDDMHARYYSPTAGRFISVDPLLGSPYIPQSWNRYAYVSNNPLTFNDPFGLAATTTLLGDGGAPGNVDCPPGTEGISCFTKTAPDPNKPKPKRPPKPRPQDFLDNVREFARFKAASLARTTKQFGSLMSPKRVLENPHYMVVTLSSGPMVGGEVEFVGDQYGRIYFGGGVTGGTPGFGASVEFGSLPGSPSPSDVAALLKGWSATIGGGAFFGGAVTFTQPPNSLAAGQYGLTTPSFGTSVIYTFGPFLGSTP